MNEKSENISGGPEVSRNPAPVGKPCKTQELGDKLCLAARKSGTRRFHQLYDRIYGWDFMAYAWKKFNMVDTPVHECLALWWGKKHGKSGRRWKHDLHYQD